jgi:signal transduction histidine kinase
MALLVGFVLRTFRAAVGETRRRTRELEVVATLRGREVERLSELERRLEETYRLQMLARLAGGAVHDVESALSLIEGASAHLLHGLPLPSPERDAACTIHEAAVRAAGLTRQLLDLGRAPADARPTDLRDVVAALRPTLSRLTGDKIALHIDAGREPCLVHADRDQLGELVVNLAMNARDAMPDGGELTICTTKVLAAKLGRELVALSVLDTGLGMDEDTQRRIFDPHFTTKGGKGTGLGLAVVHRIVTEHGGRIHVESGPGEGARFDILLPALRP